MVERQAIEGGKMCSMSATLETLFLWISIHIMIVLPWDNLLALCSYSLAILEWTGDLTGRNSIRVITWEQMYPLFMQLCRGLRKWGLVLTYQSRGGFTMTLPRRCVLHCNTHLDRTYWFFLFWKWLLRDLLCTFTQHLICLILVKGWMQNKQGEIW